MDSAREIELKFNMDGLVRGQLRLAGAKGF